MFKDFTHRHTPCMVDLLPEAVILSRETKATTIMGKEYVYNGLFSPTSAVKNGSVVEAADTYFVQTLRLTVEKDKYCSLIKTNAAIDIHRLTNQYDANDNAIRVFVPVSPECKTFAQQVTAQLRQEEPGLLPTTVYTLLLLTAPAVDILDPRDPSLLSPDRIILNGRPYQVDVVDRVKYPGLLYIQLSEDAR